MRSFILRTFLLFLAAFVLEFGDYAIRTAGFSSIVDYAYYLLIFTIFLSAYWTFRFDTEDVEREQPLAERFGLSVLSAVCAGGLLGLAIFLYAQILNPEYPEFKTEWAVRFLGPNARGADSAGDHFVSMLIYSTPFVVLVEPITFGVLSTVASTLVLFGHLLSSR